MISLVSRRSTMKLLKRADENTMLNAVHVTAAIWLFVSPWLLGYSVNLTASWNAWIAAIPIAGFALSALTQLQAQEEWGLLTVGLWAIVAPWVLGFTGEASALWSHVGAGALVSILAATDLWLTAHPPHLTA
jgi:hypothetical protein